MYVLCVPSAVLAYGAWYYPLIFFFCSGSLTRGHTFLFCCNTLNSTSAGSFACVYVDIVSSAFNLSIEISFIVVVIFPS